MILIREDSDGDIDLRWHPTLRTFPLRKVKGTLWLRSCKLLRSLSTTLEVGVDLDLDGCVSLTRLPTTLRVGWALWLRYTPVTELPKDLDVGGNLWLHGSKVTYVPKGARIEGDVVGLGERDTDS